jgi:hypothetical protein
MSRAPARSVEDGSNSLVWYPNRNQVIRNLEVTQALAAGQKSFAVLLCAEEKTELPDEVWKKSLPHLLPSEIKNLKSHYLGWTEWSKITKILCPGLSLPEDVDAAIATLLRFRNETSFDGAKSN